MMDSTARIATAAAVLLGGILLAMLFRREAPTGTPPPDADEHLVLHKWLDPQRAAEAAAPQGTANAGRAAPAPMMTAGDCVEPTVLKPISPRPVAAEEPPAAPARDGAHEAAMPARQEGASPDSNGASAAAEKSSPRTHKIVDGDTLRGLAQRYLGSADRSWEIYQANRDRMLSPEVLPIGLELRIPPRSRPGPSPANLMPKRPLVPVED
jgi:hypothetical protein